MSEAPSERRVLVSGERAAPGIYRDIETGAIVRLFTHDELPDRARIVRSPRLFIRVEEEALNERNEPALAAA